MSTLCTETDYNIISEQLDGPKKQEFKELHALIEEEVRAVKKKRDILVNLDLFVLDNSLRESTVGQVRGHTLDNKRSILEEVKKCGFKNIIVSAFSHAHRVDDTFVRELSAKETDLSKYYAFSEIGEGKNKEDFPIGLKKMKEYKLENPIIEIDLCRDFCKAMFCLLQERIYYTFKELCPTAKIFVNLRDFPFAMKQCPDLVFQLVEFLAQLPKDRRPIGIIYEEPTGRFLPEQMGGWTKAIRTLMDKKDWKNGHLLVHVHKKWEFAEVVQLECLSCGADGVWASVCEEGAALGHACSIISIMNLVRLGNKKVLENYNCHYLREAAIKITNFTTGNPPHSKQALYGERALDLAFGFGRIAGGEVSKDEFDVAKFFGVKPPQRITTMSTTKMLKQQLVDLFGDHQSFTDKIAERMKEVIQEDLDKNRKEEYMSHMGFAVLFDRAGGHITARMSEKIAMVGVKSDYHQQLLTAVRNQWDDLDMKEKVEDQKDDMLNFHSFYNGFMSPYFGCYECDEFKACLRAIDMDHDGKVDWNEFCVYLKWALRQYPDIPSMEQLLITAFTRGLIPAMQDELLASP